MSGDAPPALIPTASRTLPGIRLNSIQSGIRGEGPEKRSPPVARAGTVHTSAQSAVPDRGATCNPMDAEPQVRAEKEGHRDKSGRQEAQGRRTEAARAPYQVDLAEALAEREEVGRVAYCNPCVSGL